MGLRARRSSPCPTGRGGPSTSSPRRVSPTRRPLSTPPCAQAVWSAVGRGLAGFEDHAAAWRAFDDASRDAGGLMPVADAYPSYRLWCQTEPAMWLLVERELFDYEA